MTEKAGRNDPCPCGSGKKFKKCCWQKGIKSHNWRQMEAQGNKTIASGITNVTSLMSNLQGQLQSKTGVSVSNKEKKVNQEVEELHRQLEHATPDNYDEIKERIKEKMDEGMTLSEERSKKAAKKEAKPKVVRKKDTGKPF